MNVIHPVGDHPGYEDLLGCYLHDVILGNNCNNQQTIRSKTLEGYAEAVNKLFELRDMPLPYLPHDKSNDATVAIKNLADEETVAKQRLPLDDKIAAECVRVGTSAHQNSSESLIGNVICIARYVGQRVSEYAQTQQKKVNYHTWKNSRKKIVRSWIAEDFIFYDSNHERVNLRGRTNESMSSIINDIHYMTITWRIQKNRRNGQTIKIPVDRRHVKICPVFNALQIVMRKFRLDSRNLDTPVCVFAKAHSTTPLYLTGKMVKEFLQKAVKTVRPTISEEELQKYSAHSLRVWPCVLLDEAGKITNLH